MFPLIGLIWKNLINFELDFEGSFGKSTEKDLLGVEFLGKRKSLVYSYT